MNFDRLKEAWHNDAHEDKAAPSLDMAMRKAVPVMDRVRRTMKIEMAVQFGFYLLLLLVLFLWIDRPFLTPFVFVFAVSLLIQTVYYGLRFYRFYKSASCADLNIRKNTRHLIYSLEVHIELYKSYLAFSLPLVGSLFFILFARHRIYAYFQSLLTSGTARFDTVLLYYILFLLFFQIFLYFLLTMHLNYHYGRYLKELKKIWDDLETEETEVL